MKTGDYVTSRRPAVTGLVCGVGVACLLAAMPCRVEAQDKCDPNRALAEIAATGAGSRFVLVSVRPIAGGTTGTLKLAATGTPDEWEANREVIVGTPPFISRTSTRLLISGALVLPEERGVNGDGTVFVFTGRARAFIRQGPVIFDGDKQDPLQFGLLEKHGLVYLCGSGKVVSPDGTEVMFPPPPVGR
jgi:hypothetical protein